MNLFVYIPIILLMLPYLAIAEEQNNCEECIQEERVVKFKCPPRYEDSKVFDPIERDPVMMRPSSHESSFYKEMTR